MGRGRGGGGRRGAAVAGISIYQTGEGFTVHRVSAGAHIPAGLAERARETPPGLAVYYNPQTREWHIPESFAAYHADFAKQASGTGRVRDADTKVTRGTWRFDDNLVELYDISSQAEYLAGGNPLQERRIINTLQRNIGAAKANLFVFEGRIPTVVVADIEEVI